MLTGFLRRLKRPSIKEESSKPIYKLNKNNGMYDISCPFCNQLLLQVYYLRVDEVKIGSCRYCGKELEG